MKELHVTTRDGAVYAIPVEVIAKDRAAWYAVEFGGNVELSLRKDTLPLFEENPGEIIEWAVGNMNWSDVVDHARLLRTRPPDDCAGV